MTVLRHISPEINEQEIKILDNWGGGNSKKVNTHPKIPEIDLDFFRLF